MSEQTKSISLIKQQVNDNSQFVSVINDNYPVAIQDKFKGIVALLDDEKQLSELYPEVLAEIPLSSSQFQDQCVQYGQHFTPHKKLRQTVLELQDKLGALYAAKTGNKKAIIRVEKIKLKIEELNKQLDSLDNSSSDSYDFDIRKLKLDILTEQVKLEEKKRALNSSNHLIKDSMVKVAQHQALVKKFKKEVEESGLSFEESEVLYYVMYFTYDVEKQLRTGGRIDTGTFGAIGQLPEPIRLKVLSNISFIKHKLFDENYPAEGDYLCKVYYDTLKPSKTGDGEMEGLNVEKFISTEPIKLLSKD